MLNGLNTLLKKRGPEVRYGIAVIVLIGLFSQFVACGSQMYKASMEGDHEGAEPSQLAGGSDDPDSEWYGIHTANSWGDKFPINVQFSYTLSEEQKIAFEKAMKIWEFAASGKKLFTIKGITKISAESFTSPADMLNLGTNGFFTLGDSNNSWDRSGKPSSVLATTHWRGNPISESLKVFNTQYYVPCDAYTQKGCKRKNSSDTRITVHALTVALHEIGHELGLGHVKEAYDRNSIMLAALYIGDYVGQQYLSVGDIKRLHKIIDCDNCENPEVLAVKIRQSDPTINGHALVQEH